MKKFILSALMLAVCSMYPCYAMEPGEHAAMRMEHSSAAPVIDLQVYKITDKNGMKIVQVKLTNTSDGKPVTLEDLKEVHTKKIHLLIIDDSLQDYSHEHPKSTDVPGLYEFAWQPKNPKGNYYVWADLLPLSTDTEEYDRAVLLVGSAKQPAINSETVMRSSIAGYNFNLSFATDPLVVGQMVMGKIYITDSEGKPVTKLEPVLGAFAHIVGFSADLTSVAHIHPIGKEPTKPSDRGGPEVQFHIKPEQAGFMKLFAQFRISGKDLYVPFAVTVAAS